MVTDAQSIILYLGVSMHNYCGFWDVMLCRLTSSRNSLRTVSACPEWKPFNVCRTSSVVMFARNHVVGHVASHTGCAGDTSH